MADYNKGFELLADAEKRITELETEVKRLRDINFELVHTHNTLVVENARQERAIWRFSGDPRAAQKENGNG
jgi:hypothetical protein